MTEQRVDIRQEKRFRRFVWFLSVMISLAIAYFISVPTTRARDDISGTTDTSFKDLLQEHSPIQTGAQLDRCGVCHDDINLAKGTVVLPPQSNPFGIVFATAYATYETPVPDTKDNRAFAVERVLNDIASANQNDDADGDGYTNFEEIVAGTHPGCKGKERTASSPWCFDTDAQNAPSNVTIDITVSPVNEPVAANQPFPVSLIVSNSGQVPLDITQITAPPFNQFTCESTALQELLFPGTSRTIPCTLTVPNELKAQPFVARAEAKSRLQPPISDQLDTGVDFQVADIAAASPAELIVGNGSTLNFEYKITNIGEIPLTLVSVTVELEQAGTSSILCRESLGAPLALTEALALSCPLATITRAGTVAVYASGEYAPGKRVNAQPAKTSIQIEGIAIQLSTDITATVRGETIPYTATITNTSSSVGPTGAALDGIEVPPFCGTGTLPAIPPGNKRELTCTVQATLGENGFFTHSVAISGTINGRNVTNQDNFTVAVEERAPSINVNIAPTTHQALPGEQVTIDFEIQNTGNVALSGVNLTVPQAPQCNRTVATLATQSRVSQSCQVTIDENRIEVINGKPVYSIIAFATGTDDIDQVEVSLPGAVSVTLNASQQLFLPVIYSSPPHYVDLIVESITVDERGVEVVIKNRGDAALQGTGYWVDLYFNPSRAPTGVNQLARDWGDAGLVWGIPADASALAPGQTRMLYVADPFYVDELSFIPRNLDPGSKIYVQVDSANQATEYGAIRERHEILGDAYNNISEVTLFELVNTDNWPAIEAAQASEMRRESRHLRLQVPRESEENQNGQP